MQIKKPSFNFKIGIHFLFLSASILIFALLLRNSGVYPVVFGDEYFYSKFSRLLPLTESPVPGYIYLIIYRLTNICGDGFLEGARILNVFFFIAATPFIYLTAKLVCSRDVACIVTTFAILGPINSYTAYFMPESLYFLSFWIFTWFVLRLDNKSDSKYWCLGGILLGFSALIKPHALFCLPPIVAYVLFIKRRTEGEWVLQALRNAIVFVGFAFFTKLLIGYFFAGKTGVTLFGSLYSSIADSTSSNFLSYQNLLALSIQIVKGHGLGLCLIFGMPIACVIIISFNSLHSKMAIKNHQKISFYALVLLVTLVSVSSIFTASVSQDGTLETISRLHMRYYNFALPLLLVIAASQLTIESNDRNYKGRTIIAVPIGTAILYAVYSHLAPYAPAFVDSPELRGFTFRSSIFYVLSGASFFSLILWVYSTQLGGKFFVYCFTPLAVIFSSFFVNQELRQHLEPTVFDKAGIFAKYYLPNEDRSNLLIVGSERIGMYKSLFHLDNPKASLETIPSESNFELSKIPAGKEWILVIGDHKLPDNTFFQIPMNGFTLVRIDGYNTVDFKKSSWPGVISSSNGLYSAEAWGTWSSSNLVTLKFFEPLPERFTIHLVAFTFGPNVGKEFVAHVGDSKIRFTLGGFPADGVAPEELNLEFHNPKRSKVVKIEIPQPSSPKELGISGDERSLGIALIKLRITES